MAALAFTTPEDLRDHLDRLKDHGISFVAVGIDSLGIPFLAQLIGTYADSESVIFGDPWDREVDYGRPPRCEACGAHPTSSIQDLKYPVVVMEA